MAGWHTRLWRRVRIAPGVTINLSKSGASISVGPRGAKVTVGRRGVRQTLGIPGTGIFATRQLGGPRAPSTGTAADAADLAADAADLAADAAAADPAAADPAPTLAMPAPEADDDMVLYFGLATVVGVLFGLALLIAGRPANEALTGGAIAIVAGIVYEGLAHHHPGPAKAVASVVIGLISIITAVLAALAIAVIGGLLLGAAGSGRSRRRRGGGW